MAVSKRTRKADAKGRVLLPAVFANTQVIIERVSDDEVRIRKAKIPIKRFSLRKLVAGITDENRHEEIDTGPAVGGEAW